DISNVAMHLEDGWNDDDIAPVGGKVYYEYNRKSYAAGDDVIIKVNPERADLVETRWIDGRQCLVIKVDDHIEVNGVQVRTLRTPGRPNPVLQ
ncbi:MAG: DUF4317 family protein, partial [Lachnospiraceae bacterium]|nr:DUF4317 family protein [Lachnospiraceae bacterium]